MTDPAAQHANPVSDLAIAQAVKLRPIAEVAARLGIPPSALVPIGRDKAKIGLDVVKSLHDRPDGRLVLVTAISPTPAGEGKTTTSIGLVDGLGRLGKKVAAALREPSLGPVFGQKGGATGGGYAQIVPMEDINLHFTGDFHAISAANNLLSAMLDNHLYWGNALGIDPRRVAWRRALDVNDRALRHMVAGLGGVTGGIPREEGFDITAASEVMAVLCLARDLADLQRRLGNIVVGERYDRSLVRAEDLKSVGAMTALLKDAMMPNLVQTLEGTPALVHGGPFANIAHGCNSVIATRTALKLADIVVTEAGFGADLGAEKFCDIKCRQAGLVPDGAVLVCTIRALKMHGGKTKEALADEDLAAVERGFANLARHAENLRRFGLPVVVAINCFSADTAAETALVKRLCRGIGLEAVESDHWARGGAGAEALAAAVLRMLEHPVSSFRLLYDDELPLTEKIRTIAREIYGAADIALDGGARSRLKEFEARGFGTYPVCIAKTQYSFSTDASLRGAPTGHTLAVRQVRLAAGAEFVVALCGDIMTMPGLPRRPAAEHIGIDTEGRITGLS
jgi:formate--tetrahydrofolate ligase